jgi:hypothetical protein
MQLSAFHQKFQFSRGFVSENNIDIDFFELFHLNANQEYKKTGIINNTFYSELRSIHGSAKTLELDCIGKSSNFEIPITDNYSFLKFQDKVNEIDNYLKYQFRWDEDTISRILFDSVIFNKFNEGRELSIYNLRNKKHIKNLDFDQVTFLLNRGILLISYPTLKDSLNTYLLDLKNFSLIDSLITSGYLKDICDIDTVNKYFCSVHDVHYGAKISFKHDYIHGYHNMEEKNTNLHKGIPFPVFSDDFKYVVTTSLDGKTKVWDNKTDSLIFDLDDSLKGSSFTSLGYYDQYNNLVYDVKDKVLRCWNPKNSNIIFSLALFNNGDYLIKVNNSPYYMCSKDASKMLHYVTPSLKVIGFEQLDPVYNRPDIVLDSIGKYFGGADQELVSNYRQSWEKRIDRLGLDKEKLGKGEIAVPNAEIVGADAIAYDNKNGKLDIKVAANDPKYPLRRFNVYVNEVPLYGSDGISIAHLKKQVWDTTVSVPLSMGENKIQVSVMNELGLENFKYPTYVNYTPSEPIVAKTYYIGIGVNEFKEPGHKLNYCVKDVTDLSTSFGGPNTEVKLFTNVQVTKENILALKDYLAKTTVNDKVIISCSSHGLLDDSLNFYLAMHDVDFNNPKERGLKYEELENLLDGIPARQKLLLLDACNSGENDKTELIKRELGQKNSKMDSTQILAARGVIVKLEDENKSNFKKMNELFVNVRNNTGSVIISAAGGQESALEAITVDGKSIENGAFSYCVLEYLKNNSNNPEELTVNKLKNYVEKRVEEITNGKQQPTSRQETMEVDWGLR